MRRYPIILACLICAGLLLLPAVCSARDGAVARAATSADGSTSARGAAPYGKPWAGSYLRMIPRDMTRTTTRVVWVKFSGLFRTWADGFPGWDQAHYYNIVLEPFLKGSITRVLKWEWSRSGSSYDSEYQRGLIFYSSGRAKVRLTAGNGLKTIKLYFKAFVLNENNGASFTPNYPVSPIYKKTVKLAM
jgi:hypothetical protein